jgi:hypothetical protein
MSNLLSQIESLKTTGCKFVGLNNYTAKTSGEIANYTINLGISVENTKKQDLQKLEDCEKAILCTLSESSNIPLAIFETALNELIQSARKNLSENMGDRTAQSQAQTAAYLTITSGLKLCKETLQLHIFGQIQNKTIIQKGEYKTVNSSDKTIAKNMIKKALNLRSEKFRTFILDNISSVKMNGDVFEIG